MGHPHAVIMPQTKNIQGKFYPLQHEELINLNKRLTASELSVYLWLKTNEPFGDKLVEADTLTIAKDLNISRRTVQRALVKLRQEKLIDLVITKFHYRVRSKSAKEPDNTNENSNNTSEVKERLRVATSVSPSVRQCRHRYENVAISTRMSPTVRPCRHRSLKPNQSKAFKILRILRLIQTLKDLSQKTRARIFSVT